MTTIICPVENCDKAVIKRLWCERHYRYFMKYGNPDHTPKITQRHGAAERGNKSKLYDVYQSIKDRTTNPKAEHYSHYGGRGIVMCNGWRHSFISFADDLGAKPSISHSVDRTDNSGNYSCGHCEQCTNEGWTMNVRWATRRQQVLNRRLNGNNTSGYRGVVLDRGKYVAKIWVNYKSIHLGRYDTPTEAALAYNMAAKQYNGDDAQLNEV